MNVTTVPPGTNTDSTNGFSVTLRSSCPHMGSLSPAGVAVIAVDVRNRMVLSEAFNDYTPYKKIKSCDFDLEMSPGSLEAIMRGHNATLIIDVTCTGTSEGTISIIDLSTAINRNKVFQLKSAHGKFITDELRLLLLCVPDPCRIVFIGIEILASVESKLPGSFTEQAPLAMELSSLIASVVAALSKTVKAKSYSTRKRTQ